ncbi:MAG: hypothetical protein JXA66_02470 [Oligoflexia bacterium]|nr:hypothetical protein [Oligoflexia bacterium]
MQYVRKISHATSVKEISILKEATPDSYGETDFNYKPVFSVFDIGTIHPPVPLDNSTINIMQGFNFELLREKGIESHYIGLVTNEGTLISAKEAISGKITPTISRVRFVNRLMPEFANGKWDYSIFREPPCNNFVLPVEFISRNNLPESSSVWRRIADRELNLEDMGLPSGFKKGDRLPEHLKPILDFSTKFEPDDRYISARATLDLLGIDDASFDLINKTTRNVSNIMTEYAESAGFKREDGKVEYVTYVENDRKKYVLGDAVCTWHEDRLITPQGLGISKQIIRDKVKSLNPAWYEEIQRAKKLARTGGIRDFRTVMDPEIKYISPDAKFFEAVNTLFRAGTNQWVNHKIYNIFPDKNESIRDNLARAVEEISTII